MANENNSGGDPSKQTANTQGDPPAKKTEGDSGDAARIAALEKTVNSLAAALRRDNKGGSKGTENQPPAAKGTAEQEATLRGRIEALEADRREVEAERRNIAIRSAASAAGVAEDRLDIFVDHVNAKHGERIKVDKRTVFAEDELGQPVELKDFVGGLVSKLEFFKAPAQVPNSGALKGQPARSAAGANGQKTILDFTAQELAKMQTEKPDEFRKLVKASGL